MFGSRQSSFDGDGPATTTILTLELPFELNFRLRQAMRRLGLSSLTQVALDALEAWVEREERRAEAEEASGEAG